jgi:hypothetical protein
MDFTTGINNMPVPSRQELHPRISLETLLHLLRNVRFGIDIDRMRKVSLIYDIVLSETVILTSPTYKNVLNVLCEKAAEHLAKITAPEFMEGLSNEDLQQQKHFRCLLEKFIDRSFGTPNDYGEYSYHYDIMRVIGYDDTLRLNSEIFNYALSCDFDPILVREYLQNRVSVYQLYALVTYCEVEVLPNNVQYETVLQRIAECFRRDERA